MRAAFRLSDRERLHGLTRLSRLLCRFHEYSLFSAPTADGLGNLPGRALFPRIISTLQGFTESDNELLVSHLHMSYKPFISIFSESLTSFLAPSRWAGSADTEMPFFARACAPQT